MTRIVGIDLSLTSTGIAIIDIDDDGTVVVSTGRIKSTGSTSASLASRHRRLNMIAAKVLVSAPGADLVVIEGPAYAAKYGSSHDRSGLWWLVVSRLVDQRIPSIEIAPTTRCVYATGRGGAAKDEVLAAAIRRYPNVDIGGNDQADAVILAAIGARLLERPIEASLPQTHLRAMAAVTKLQVAS